VSAGCPCPPPLYVASEVVVKLHFWSSPRRLRKPSPPHRRHTPKVCAGSTAKLRKQISLSSTHFFWVCVCGIQSLLFIVLEYDTSIVTPPPKSACGWRTTRRPLRGRQPWGVSAHAVITPPPHYSLSAPPDFATPPPILVGVWRKKLKNTEQKKLLTTTRKYLILILGMKFKEQKLREHFWQVKPKLRLILCHLDYCAKNWLRKEITITSIIRPKTTDSGIHALKRAADVRTKKVFTKREIEKIMAYFNWHYQYDPKRPNIKTFVYHKVEGSEFHFHIQVLW
jgi:hypothetical protein